MKRYLVDIITLEKNDTFEIESVNLELAAELAEMLYQGEGKLFVTDLDSGKAIEIK